jgi:MOSC domain-containing protein YiiM
VSATSGTLVSVNTGRVEELVTRARTFRTAIVKRPRTGPVHAGRLGLEGDEQGDRRVHGGVDKAVYLYTAEHYDFWRGELGEPELSPGTFGENLTVAGLDETQLHIGDELMIGGARFQVSEPRLPCATLAARMGRPDMQKRFVASERPGVYLRVLVEGPVETDEAVEVVYAHAGRWSVRQVFRLATGRENDASAMRELLALAELGGVRANIERRLSALTREPSDLPGLAR